MTPSPTTSVESARTSSRRAVGNVEFRRQEFRRQIEGELPGLRRRALGLTRNREQAEELVQDTVVRALRFEESYREDSNFGAWLNRVLYNVFISNCRVRVREGRALGALTHDPNSWCVKPSRIVVESLSPPVAEKLSRLPDSFEEVIRMVDLGETSYRDAAETIGVPVGTVMSRLFRGRRMLRDLLEPQLPCAA